MRRGGHASERQLSNPYLCSKDTPGSMEGTNMKPIISAVLASLAVLGLVAGCSSDSKSVIGSPISVNVCVATLHCSTCRVWNAYASAAPFILYCTLGRASDGV